MPQTAVQICNSALTKLGARTITALSDTTKEGVLSNLRFAQCRNLLLRGHVWAFSKAATSVASSGASAVTPWLYTIPIPSTALRILSATVNNEVIDYERVGSNLLTLTTPVVIRYVNTPADDATYPDDFAEALACYLAADICMAMTQDDQMRQGLYLQYKDQMRDARFNGAVERSAMRIEANDFLFARDTYGTEDQRDALPLDTP